MAPSRGPKMPSNVVASLAKHESPRAALLASINTALLLQLQQRILDLFASALATQVKSNLQPLLQEVKQHLYNRDFRLAFGRQEYCAAYAARWSPTRALCYLSLFDELLGHLLSVGPSQPVDSTDSTDSTEGSPLSLPLEAVRITCIGGGAGAELVACGGLLALDEQLRIHQESGASQNFALSTPASKHVLRITLNLVDSAPWDNTIGHLIEALTKSLPSPYASASLAGSSSSKPLVLEGQNLHATFKKIDVLDATSSATEIVNELLRKSDVVTLCFTLNELYTASVTATQAFLGRVTAAMPTGKLLLIVDSPGSYARVALRKGGEDREYPMQFLLDYALIGAKTHRDDSSRKSASWVKLVETPSRWFRLPQENGRVKGKVKGDACSLNYPIELENMRFQMHLYRRL